MAQKEPQRNTGISTISSETTAQSGSAARSRAISDGVAGAFKSAAPRFEATAADAKEEARQAPLDIPDTPKNQIYRLDPLIIQEKSMPVFREKDMYSSRDLATLMVQRYLSDLDRAILNRWTLPLFGISKEKRAMAMFLEDERLRNIAELKDDADNAQRAGSKEQADFIRRTSNDTFMRRIDFGFSKSRDSRSESNGGP